MSKALNNQENSFIDLKKHELKHRTVCFGGSMVAGVTGIATLANEGFEITPTNMQIGAPDVIIVGMFTIVMASAFKRHVSTNKIDKVISDNEKYINQHGNINDKIAFNRLKNEAKKYTDDASKRWKKARNKLLSGGGIAVIASAMTVGVAVITPAVAVLTAVGTIVGVMGVTDYIKLSEIGHKRMEKIQEMVEIKRDIQTKSVKNVGMK